MFLSVFCLCGWGGWWDICVALWAKSEPNGKGLRDFESVAVTHLSDRTTSDKRVLRSGTSMSMCAWVSWINSRVPRAESAPALCIWAHYMKASCFGIRQIILFKLLAELKLQQVNEKPWQRTSVHKGRIYSKWSDSIINLPVLFLLWHINACLLRKVLPKTTLALRWDLIRQTKRKHLWESTEGLKCI